MSYFDLQINGYAGVDFNSDDLQPDDLHRACAMLKDHGVGGVLATVITELVPGMQAKLRRLVELREQDPLVAEMIVGLHIEGPFINPEDGYRGAHPVDAVRPADLDSAKALIDAGQGLVRIMTLAPEQDDGGKVIRWLSDQGVTVSAGHCNASIDQLDTAIDAGLRMYTHLGNGCPMNMHRHENIVQRALSRSDRLWLCFIPDGAHVPFYALRNYIKAAGVDRCVVVTDAVAPAGMGPGRYRISRWDLYVGEDSVVRSPDGSHLVGAAITMPQCQANLIDKVGLTEKETQQLVVDNPRRAIGL